MFFNLEKKIGGTNVISMYSKFNQVVGGSRGPNNANRNIVRQIAKFGIIVYCKIIINI